MNRKMRKNRFGRWGATVVETAVVAPIVLAGTFGAMLVGYSFMARQSVTLAAREGARAGAMPGANAEDVQSRVDAAMSGVGLSGYTTDIDLGSDADPEVSVTVTLPFDRSSMTVGFFSGTFDISSTAVMRREGSMPEDGDGQGIQDQSE